MHTRTDQRHFRAGRQRGIALVIVLSFVVLLTVAVVAYFSRTISERQVANDSYNGGKTDQLARSALDVIVSDFKQEIVNGSYPTTINGVTTYYPSSADGTTLLRANMLPQRSGNPGTPPFTSTNPDPIPNLVRRSVANDTMASPGVASRASPVNSYTNASANGRLVSLARWNKHFLIPQKDATGSKPDPVASFNAPDWVMMTQEEGPVVLQSPTKDASGNTVTVTGRYAYAVYDEGGLLDANVAGFPSGATSTQLGYKSSLGMADLPTALAAATPAVTISPTAMVDKLVGWRNYATTQPSGVFPNSSFASNFAGSSAQATLYFNALQTNYSGFTRTSNAYWENRTDQAFLSRQQLLGFQQTLQQTSPGSFPASALQYLGTFSRELNAPSWGPTQNATDLGSTVNVDTNNRPCNYRDNRNNDTVSGTNPLQPSYNRLLPGVRYANAGVITSYNVDGTAYTYSVKAGGPLVQRRFPLGRLAWIGPNGPRTDLGATDASIQACFGLKWVTASNYWQYVAPGSQYIAPATAYGDTSQIKYAIKSLGEVAQESPPREPNFFELLEAGMLSGSLAMSGQDRSQYSGIHSASNFSFNTSPETWPDLHVFRIGASIITQSQKPDPNTGMFYPVVIDYARNSVNVQAVGVDDLPYLNMYHMLAGKNGSQMSVECFLLFGLWNPNQSASTPKRPPIRLCTQGSVLLKNDYGIYSNSAVSVNGSSYDGYQYDVGATETDGIAKIPLSTSSATSTGVYGFTDPHVIQPGDSALTLDAGTAAGGTWSILPSVQNQSYVGYRLPDYVYDTRIYNSSNPTNSSSFDWSRVYFYINTNAAEPFNAWLEYQTSAGVWIPYTYLAGIDHLTNWWTKTPGIFTAYMGPNTKTTGGVITDQPAAPGPIDEQAGQSDIQYYQQYPQANTDPRSMRFNYSSEQTPVLYPDWATYLHASQWSSLTELYTSNGLTYIGRPAFQNFPSYFYPAGYVLGQAASWSTVGVARNNTTPNEPNASVLSSYADPDGVQRYADSGLFTAAASSSNSWAGDPYAVSTTRSSDRPIILHRPFTNVGELGYVSRDYPWRTLDFYTAKSADAALLDLFTANANTGAFSAGRINLNTRNLSALYAMLCGSVPDIISGTVMQSSKALSIATKLAALTASTATGSGPLIGKDELATRFVPTLTVSDFLNSDDQNIKARRETVTRAFAEVGQTRTWNLLIDIVAQSGRYGPNATLTQFNVEGERHYWLHVAIDRFTGNVIDQQLEAVTE